MRDAQARAIVGTHVGCRVMHVDGEEERPVVRIGSKVDQPPSREVVLERPAPGLRVKAGRA
jgi:hypothetical protein